MPSKIVTKLTVSLSQKPQWLILCFRYEFANRNMFTLTTAYWCTSCSCVEHIHIKQEQSTQSQWQASKTEMSTQNFAACVEFWKKDHSRQQTPLYCPKQTRNIHNNTRQMLRHQPLLLHFTMTWSLIYSLYLVHYLLLSGVLRLPFYTRFFIFIRYFSIKITLKI